MNYSQGIRGLRKRLFLKAIVSECVLGNVQCSSECSASVRVFGANRVFLSRVKLKQVWRSLSLSYNARHEKIDLKVFVVVIRKEDWAPMRTHPSFGMTTTKTLRSVFSGRASITRMRLGWHQPNQAFFCYDKDYIDLYSFVFTDYDFIVSYRYQKRAWLVLMTMEKS